jgi:membrane protease YdiL (CAAX protease family)
MNGTARQSGWARFWNHGRWWKALILAVGYLVLYEAASLLVAPLLPFIGGAGTASYVVVLYVIPILFGGVILVVFGASVGWLRGLLARQRIRGRGWMWIAVAVVLLFNILRFASIDYGRAGFGWVAAWMLAGLFIGFAEEVLTRGYVVRIMRDAGHSEVAVALVSAALFALLHSVNLFTGQAILPTLLQLVYTFFFGICMYLALRVTGTLIAPILLHASTDPSIFMQSAYPAPGALTALSGLGNVAVIVVGAVLLVVLILTRGSVRGGRGAFEVASPGA